MTPKEQVLKLYPRALVIDRGKDWGKDGFELSIGSGRYCVFLQECSNLKMFGPAHNTPVLAWDIAWWAIQCRKKKGTER